MNYGIGLVWGILRGTWKLLILILLW